MWDVVVALVVILSVFLGGTLWFRVSWIQVNCGFQRLSENILRNTCSPYKTAFNDIAPSMLSNLSYI